MRVMITLLTKFVLLGGLNKITFQVPWGRLWLGSWFLSTTLYSLFPFPNHLMQSLTRRVFISRYLKVMDIYHLFLINPAFWNQPPPLILKTTPPLNPNMQFPWKSPQSYVTPHACRLQPSWINQSF